MGQQVRRKEIRKRRKRYHKNLKQRKAERIAGVNNPNPVGSTGTGS